MNQLQKPFRPSSFQDRLYPKEYAMGHHGNAFTSFGAVAAVGGWVELARTTLGSANQNITVSSLANKRYYMVLAHVIGATIPQVRLGNSTIDSGSNYASRLSNDGGADTIETSVTEMYGSNSTISAGLQVVYFANLSGKEKLMQSWCSTGATLGAGNASQRTETVGKWNNVSNPLDIINWIDVSATNFLTGSEVVVLGWDPADTHTNNFWEELDTDTGASIDLSFTGKKYMWLQFYLKATGGTLNPRMRVGKTTVDTGSTIAQRGSSNGAADATSTSQTFLDILGITLQSGESIFGNYFIVNVAANEKLMIGHTVSNNGSGAGVSPDRFEYVGKWANAVDLMDVLQITKNSGTGTQDTSSFAKIWGSN